MTEVRKHLQEVTQSFKGYFHNGEVTVALKRTRNQFLFNSDSADGSDVLKDYFAELQASDTM